MFKYKDSCVCLISLICLPRFTCLRCMTDVKHGGRKGNLTRSWTLILRYTYQSRLVVVCPAANAILSNICRVNMTLYDSKSSIFN